jgi:prophage antirepressor-like protein
MNLIKQEFDDSPIRMAIIDGEPWWVAKDVCDILGLEQVSRALDRLEQDQRGVLKVTHPQSVGKYIEMASVTESGLYELIIRSDRPEARRFRKWITSVVLPSIRKTGNYTKSEAPKGPELLALAVLEAARMIEAKDLIIAELAPSAAAADRITNAVGLKSLSEIGKINGIGPRKIFDLLADQGIMFRRGESWIPYQQYVDSGYFRVRESTYEMNGVDHLYSKTYVTGRGEVWIAKRLIANEVTA